ncbi:hypothetical protein THRCLA_23243 [Thraustotheca clavata]|uniref:Meckel syndrome type 1 protein n=1 Tax=Thraustotheca clavata TaxID=74557 RepID=A0A1V9Y8V9_9STRA|nr:hypothetical protein THRCLA_23243 [Thraustotheca clavata]
MDYRQRIIEKEAKNQSVVDVNQQVVLSTYVDRDCFEPFEEIDKRVSTSVETCNAIGIKTAKSHLSRDITVKSMHIVATVDITRDLYKKKYKEDAFEEHLLCTLQYYPNSKLLVLSPGFSLPIGHDENMTLLETYYFQSRKGLLYEYVVYNAQDLFIEESYEHAKLAHELFRLESGQDEEQRKCWETQCGMNGCDIPRDIQTKYQQLVHLYIDMLGVRLDNEEFGQGILFGQVMYMQYAIFLDQKCNEMWCGAEETFDKNQELYVLAKGCTQQCIPRKKIIHFGIPIEIQLRAKNTQYSPTLHLAVQLFKKDYWHRHYVVGYGNAQLPITPGRIDSLSVNLWRPLLNVEATRRNFFLGGQGQFLSIFDQHKTSFGLQTVQTGSLLYELQSIHQSTTPQLSIDAAKESKEMTFVKRGVEEIMAKVRANKLRKNVQGDLTTLSDQKLSAVSTILNNLREKKLLPATISQ